MAVVTITGWRAGFKTISFMKLLRERSQSERTLADAKSLVDGLLEGRPFTVRFGSPDEAKAFVKAANDLGAIGSFEAIG